MRAFQWAAAALLVGLCTTSALADPQVHALVGVRIVAAPGQVMESGTIVVRDGIIEGVGEIEPPADAKIWDRENLTVYAGLIEPYLEVAWPATDDEDDEAKAQGGHENTRVTPERDMTLYAHDANAFRKLRSAGFTTAVVAPGGNLFRGRSVLMSLGEGSVHENLMARHVAQNVSVESGGGTPRGYPSSLMGAVALTRQIFFDAQWYTAAQAAYEKNPRQARPAFNSSLEALGGAVAGDELVVFTTDDVLETLRVSGIIREMGLKAWLVGNGEEYKRIDAVAATNLPHLLPVAFPEAPDVGDEDQGTVSLEALRHWDRAPGNPAALHAQGIPFAFTTDQLDNPNQIHGRLATAIERGLDADVALAAVTTVPAEMLGVADRMGTIEAGKIANLTVIEGENLFDEKVKIREVWIDGHRVELKETKPPEVDPAGRWDMVVNAGDQKIPLTLVLTGDMNNVEGHFEAQGVQIPFTSIEVSGKKVEFVFSGAPMGMPGDLSFTLSIKGDSASGPGMSPFGPFTIKGTRTSKPSPEVLP